MNYKKLSKVTDAHKANEEVVHAGIDEVEIGILSGNKFTPFVGHWMPVPAGEDGDFPTEEEIETLIPDIAKKWGVNPIDIRVGHNDDYEDGYLYVESKEKGKPIEVKSEWFERQDGILFTAYHPNDEVWKIKKKLEASGVPLATLWWWPVALNQ